MGDTVREAIKGVVEGRSKCEMFDIRSSAEVQWLIIIVG